MFRSLPRIRPSIAAATACLVGAAATATVAVSAHAAATGCSVSYAVGSQWPGGFTGNVTLTNLGDPLTGWTLAWSFGAGQHVSDAWQAAVTQAGQDVSANNATWNGSLATGGSVAFGFNASWNNTSNPAPTAFTLNGVACTGAASPPPTATPPTSTPPTSTSPTPPAGGSLPATLRWSSSGALIAPKSDATHTIAGIKDPSVVFSGGKWHVFASVANASGYGLAYLNFTDWAAAGSAAQFYLDRSAIGAGYRAAPEVFWFAPQQKWYLVYQTGNASYSTNSDLNNPAGWSAPRNFYASMPDIISRNIGSGFWVDMWVICDSVNCYLFSSDDNGHLYRSQTTVANFPNGFSEPVIALQDANRNNLFEASNVYKVAGTNQYLLLIEAIGSDGRRYFRSWTSTSIAGTWTPLAASESNPFARASNVTFSGTAWSNDISHGEMIRTGTDQTLTISPCRMQYLYQGKDPSAGGDYNSLPWRLGLLTQTNSTC